MRHFKVLGRMFSSVERAGAFAQSKADEMQRVVGVWEKLDAMTPIHRVSERWPKSEEDCEVAANREKV